MDTNNKSSQVTQFHTRLLHTRIQADVYVPLLDAVCSTMVGACWAELNITVLESHVIDVVADMLIAIHTIPRNDVPPVTFAARRLVSQFGVSLVDAECIVSDIWSMCRRPVSSHDTVPRHVDVQGTTTAASVMDRLKSAHQKSEHLQQLIDEPDPSQAERGPRILLLCTGSVACITIPLLIDALRQSIPRCTICIAATASAMHFLKPLVDPSSQSTDVSMSDVYHALRGVPIFTDNDEWASWKQVGDPVLHIELRKAHDIAVLVPLDANTLSKIVHGLSDNLVTCVMRAWGIGNAGKPIVAAPAMNTMMFDNPITRDHLDTLAARYQACWTLVEPVSKLLACGDTGNGALASVEVIAEAVRKCLMQG